MLCHVAVQEQYYRNPPQGKQKPNSTVPTMMSKFTPVLPNWFARFLSELPMFTLYLLSY